ncbi:MAG TPA: hypothetical protein VLF59_04580 [Candidatus Saccharimonadales bacterium]|nr:hypothetical protein [Candidatus Saccharimonadales bacterium]
MPVVHPATYRPKPVARRRSKAWLLIPLCIVLAGAVNYLRPLPATTTTISAQGLAATTQPSIPWPAGAQAAVGAPGYGILGTGGTQKSLPIANIAKVITVLCVLQKQPLAAKESGPTYVVRSSDVTIYNDYVAKDGSVVAVALNERLTEYQALQALMVSSANNVADSLAQWVFGSQDAYKAYATDFLAEHGMADTTIGHDASGYDASTTSTASDLTKLGLLALKNPTLMEIAGQKSAILPIAGLIHNYDTILGTNGITGLKTGSDDKDRGAFLLTATVPVGDKQVLVTGAVMGADDIQTALDASAQLSRSLQQGFEQVAIAGAGSQVGIMRAPWGVSAPVVTTSALQVVRWRDSAISETHMLKANARQGVVGSLEVHAPGSASKTVLRLSKPLDNPSFWWRLTHH